MCFSSVPSGSYRTRFSPLLSVLTGRHLWLFYRTHPFKEDGVMRVSPYATYPKDDALRNSETPELYSVHSFRYYSLGRSLSEQRDLSPAIQYITNSTRQTCRNSDANGGWTQGGMNMALLGLTAKARDDVLARSLITPAKGYIFPGFAPHEQDYEPSADRYAIMNTALQWMLLHTGRRRTIGGALWHLAL